MSAFEGDLLGALRFFVDAAGGMTDAHYEVVQEQLLAIET